MNANSFATRLRQGYGGQADCTDDKDTAPLAEERKMREGMPAFSGATFDPAALSQSAGTAQIERATRVNPDQLG